MHEETNPSLPVYVKYLSPEWVEQLDKEAGEQQRKNGMNFRLEAQFSGSGMPSWFDVITRHLPWKRKNTK